MTRMDDTHSLGAEPDRHIDPRRARSRARLLDAAVSLLSTGGVEAVTVDAVTRVSKVARTTLYRHFGDSTQLLAAAFERLLPPVTAPPSTGTLRDQLTSLTQRQARLIEDAPVQLTLLGWLALGSTCPTPDTGAADNGGNSMASLRNRVVEHYREPFDRLLTSADARHQLGDFDTTLAVAQLVGPLLFARLAALPPLGPDQCRQLVDDFLAGRATTAASGTATRGRPRRRHTGLEPPTAAPAHTELADS